MASRKASGGAGKGKTAQVENKIMDTFASVASMLGYSPMHGKTIAILLMEGNPMPIQAIADRLNYSLSSISLSVDFLSAIGVIKKFRKGSDRKVYVKLSASLLDTLRRALLMRMEKAIEDSLLDFESEKKILRAIKGKKESKLYRTISLMESETKKLKSLMEFAKGINLGVQIK